MSAHPLLRRWRAARRGQRGMTLVETLLAVMLSAVMMLPMMGWATLALKEQVTTQQRNLSSSALGLLRTYFVRDVTTATWVAVTGDQLSDCSSAEKGAETLMVVATGDARLAYVLSPVDGFTWTLQRVECSRAGGAVIAVTDLAADVIQGGTAATCLTDGELAVAALAAGVGTDVTKKTAEAASEGSSCRRVTLQLTTSRLSQVALTATVRSGALSGIPDAASPSAVASATPTSGPRRLRVQFSAKDSTDPEGERLSYLWDFGDGTTSTDVTPSHDFTKVGATTVTLTVTNETGLSASAELTITVGDNLPVAVIAAPAAGSTTYRGQPVVFSSAGSNDDLDKEFGGRITGYAWDFGDGTTSTEANPTKTYTALSPADGYTVRLAVFDDAGGTATAELKLVVANRLPTVTIVASTTSGTVPLSVDFSSVVVDETTMTPNPALTYAWNFGDGGTSTVADPPARTYSTTGTKTVTLTVTDDQGATASATQTISVNAALLSAPSGLKKKTSGTTTGKRWIDLQFNAVTGAANYEVMITCVSSGCTDVASATGTSTVIRISGLQNKSLSWDAQVRTLNSTGQWGPWSAKVRVAT